MRFAPAFAIVRPVPSSVLPSTLDDLAARLIAYEPTPDDHRAVGILLATLSRDTTLPDAVRAMLAEARAEWGGAGPDAWEAQVARLQAVVEAAQHRLDLRDRIALELRAATPAASLAAVATLAPQVTPALLPEEVDVSLLRDFFAESRELLEQAEAALLQLEGDPDDAEAVNTVFRAFHTVKGTSAFLGLELVTEFAHHAETVLSRVRDREIRCVGGYADLALRSGDMLRALLGATEAALDGAAARLPDGFGPLLEVLRDPESAGVSEQQRAGAAAAPRGPASLPLDDGEARAAEAPRRPAGAPERAGDASIRVSTERLDRLVDLVGELVIAQSMIAQDEVVREVTHRELARKVQHADKILRALQDLTLGLRMVPLKAPFQKVARLVRDLAARSGKRVEFVASGEDTEIDRTMVDALGDPLVHMVRNAIDHGLEPPDERRAAGKPEHGTVHLEAYHASGAVVVELRDDGRGLNRERIVRKAVQQGLISSGDGMRDQDVYELIFAPGFSTAEAVTDLSGRGVGMDVVKRNIEGLRGRIEIHATPGHGTTFTMRLPLTLAITDGMLVRVGGERYILPTADIHLSFRPAAASLTTVVGTGEVVLLRDEVLPIVRLHRVLGVAGACEDPTRALLVVVGDDGGRRSALLVDELLGQQQVVAKSLGAGLAPVPAISGGAILGDGRVGLIVDVVELLHLARRGEGATARPTPVPVA